MKLKRFLHGIVIVPLIAVLTCTQAFGLSFLDLDGLNQFSGGVNGGVKTIYTLKLGLNTAQTNPLTALTGTNATQVATSAVVVSTEAGVLETIAAGYPAIPGGNYEGSGTWSITNTGATAALLSSGLTRYSGSTYGPGNLGVLAEPAATNRCLQSQEFDTTWAVYESAIDDQTTDTTAPDGTATADKITATVNSSSSQVYQVITLANTTRYTWSVFAKKGTTNFIAVNSANGGNLFTYFDLNTGAVGTTASGVTATIAPYGDGWFRCSCSVITVGTNGYFAVYLANANGSLAVTSGKTAYLWGAQLETGSVATSYIPTTTAAVTRAARYTTIAGAELGEDIRFDAVTKELGREQWFLGDPTSLAGVYKNAADKVVYRGVSLGAELVTNGGLDSDTAWQKGTGWAIGSGVATHSGSTSGAFTQNISVTAGKTYKISVTVSGRTSSQVNVALDDDATILVITANGTHSVLKTAVTTGSRPLQFNAITTFDGSIDNISVQEVKEFTSTTSLTANTPMVIGVHNGTDGATLYIDGTAEATDATMTTPVTWGTTVRIGADTAATAGNVLNGSVSNILSIKRGPSNWIKKTTKNNIINLYDKKRSIYSIEDLAA